MYAVRNTTTGKYLKRFSGSFNKRYYTVYYSICKEMGVVASYPLDLAIEGKTLEAMWSADSVADAKLYVNIGGVKNSVGFDLDGLEIVEVTIS